MALLLQRITPQLRPAMSVTRRCLIGTPKWPKPLIPPDDKLPNGCFVGIVASDKMNKSVTVRVQRWRIVPKYNVRQKFHRKYMAHDEYDECSIGDTVRISPCRPLSKRKFYMVQKILKKAKDTSSPPPK